MFSKISQRTSENARPMNLNMTYNRKHIQTPTKRAVQSNPVPIVSIQNQSNKGMEWGKHVWFFLHTFIEKVKDDHFQYLRQDILKFIYRICTNLPCPLCSQHAKTHLDGINFNSLQSKNQIKMTLFNFHNLLNKQKGYELFPESGLSKYINADFRKVIVNFFNAYIDKNHNLRMMTHNMHRTMTIQDLQKWFRENYNKFYF